MNNLNKKIRKNKLDRIRKALNTDLYNGIQDLRYCKARFMQTEDLTLLTRIDGIEEELREYDGLLKLPEGDLVRLSFWQRL